jgi:DNA-binding MarR family transcriptional regulator
LSLRSIPAAKIVWPRCVSSTTEARGYNVLVLSRRLPPVNLKGDKMADIQSKVDLICRLASDGKLTHAQFRVATVLLLHFHNTTTGECYPSYRQLAEKAKVTKKVAVAAIHRLMEMELISFAPNNGGRCRRNSYIVKTVSSVPPLRRERVSPGVQTGVLRTPAYIHRYKSNWQKAGGTPRVYSQPQFKPEKQINIPPPEVRAAQVAARLAGLGLGVGVR